MLFRATIVLIGFATISIELRNPLIKNFLSNKGVSVIYQAMQTGFSILPSMIASLPSFKEMYSKPMNTISTKIVEADVFIQHQMKNGIIYQGDDNMKVKTKGNGHPLRWLIV